MTSSGLDWALAAALVAVVALFAASLWNARRTSARFDRLIGDTAAARQASEAVDRRFDELRRAVGERVEGVERRLAEGQRSLSDHLGQSGRLLSDVGEKMGRIFEASQKIEKLAVDVTRLEDLLKPPKLRGALGETFLEQALAQVLPQAMLADAVLLRRRDCGRRDLRRGADRSGGQQVPARELPALARGARGAGAAARRARVRVPMCGYTSKRSDPDTSAPKLEPSTSR